MKIGVRAHDYGKHTARELAQVLHREGFEAAQLAMPKAIAGIDSYRGITPNQLKEIRTAFVDNHIDIAVLGCYMDLGNPDASVRREAVESVKACLRYAVELGAKMVGSETAYPNLTAEQKKQWYPYAVDSVQRIVEKAQCLDAVFAVEPVAWHPLDSVEATLGLIRRVDDSRHLRLIFDASNLLTSPGMTDQKTFWNGWLHAVGQYIDVLHIKDFTLDKNGWRCPTQLGHGLLRYDSIRRWLHSEKRELYLLREEMNPKFAKKDIAFLRSMYIQASP